MPYPGIFLKPNKEAAIERYHPWLFSGAINRVQGKIEEGDIVEVFSHRKKYLATGHFQSGSIAVKIFSFEQKEINAVFWEEKIREAYAFRDRLGLMDNKYSNAYRLVFSEGDGLPGLVMDYYNGVVVIQAHSAGMHRITGILTDILKDVYKDRLVAVYDKSAETTSTLTRSGEGSGVGAVEGKLQNQFLFGSSPRALILETGHQFSVDFELGQKTGFYLDQRSNRMFAQYYAKGKKVLNAFCYSGAFSVYCLKGGARMVHSVDSSRRAIEWTEENLLLNGVDLSLHKSSAADVKKYIGETDERYDMIILDPPAFAKTHSVSHNALQAYIHINTEALKRLNSAGILFTFSCSQAISREVFRSAILSAALESGRKIRVLHHLSQGPDHPVSIFHPEGEYLKGLILFVE